MHESLRLYLICRMFKWNFLPDVGGIYDQSPRILEDFVTIREIEVKEEKRQQEAEKRKQKQQSGGRGRRRR